jgi:hypothetical protein
MRNSVSRSIPAAGAAAAGRQPVVPMPLATLYPDESAVIRMLAARRAELTAALLNVAASAAAEAPGTEAPGTGDAQASEADTPASWSARVAR